MTYTLLNMVFMTIIFIVIFVLARFYRPQKLNYKSLIFMLILTLIFDSVLVGAGIVAYDTDKILGIKIGLAPVEDFAYTIVAWGLVPIIWSIASRGRKDDE